jgi:hypothetical protein
VRRVLLLVGLLWAVPASAASTYYVDQSATHSCATSTGSGALGDPWLDLTYVLRNQGVGNVPVFGADDVILLRAGTYRNAYSGFSTGCNNTGGDPGGVNSILPLIGGGTAGHPAIVQPYPGETVVLDGTDWDFQGATWTACGTSSWQSPALAFGSGTMQVWLNPSSNDDPGTRLAFDSSSTSCTGMTAGTFRRNATLSATAIFVRLADSSNVNAATVKVSCQNGDCAYSPISAIASSAAHWIVRKNPSGGDLYVKYGYYSFWVTGAATDIVIDGLKFVAAGGFEYGSCVRVYNGTFVQVKNSVCRETMGEGMELYGGGPGGGGGAGLQISNNDLTANEVYDTGRAYVDSATMGQANGQSDSDLGMCLIIKNCNTCTATRNVVHNCLAAAIFVTTSATAGLTSNGVTIDRNEVYNYGKAYRNVRTEAAINTEPQNSVAGGGVQNVTITNNYIHNETFSAGALTTTPQAIVCSNSGLTAQTNITIVNNSVRYTQDTALDLKDCAGTGVVVRNNAFHLCAQVTNTALCANFQTSSTTHDHNTYWATSSGDSVVKDTGGVNITRANVVGSWEASAVQADPLFTSGSNLDLQAGSPLIDVGSNTACPSTDVHGTARPQNAICDIGAYEFSAGGGGTVRRVRALRKKT